MRLIIRTSQFKKEFKLMLKRGKSPQKLEEVLEILLFQKNIPQRYYDHKLIGDYLGSRELHIEADWLLIYCINEHELILERTGTHSDLFKK